ncbi:MAG: site-2 protease family protein [Patescibacteria group bacterium]
MMRIGILMLASKFGMKLLPTLIKLLKGGKGLKAAFAVGSFAVWDLFFSWKFVVVLMSMLFIHESGHIWAMKKVGMKIRGFYFIPLLGAAAIPDSAFPSRKAEAYVALMGPIWGGLVALPFLMVWKWTDIPLWAGIASWIGMVNLFNLLPVLPLDGGRVLRATMFSFSRYLGLILMGILLCLGIFVSIKLRLYLFTMFFVIGGGEILYEARMAPRALRLNATLQSIRKAIPEFNPEILLPLLFAQKKSWANERTKWEYLSKEAPTFFKRLTALWKKHHVPKTQEDPVKYLHELIPWHDMDATCKELSVAIPGSFIWQQRHDHSRMNPAHMLNHQCHIVAHLMDSLREEGTFDKPDSYKMFVNPISYGWIATFILLYALVMAGLVGIMLMTLNIPGAKEALNIFMD